MPAVYECIRVPLQGCSMEGQVRYGLSIITGRIQKRRRRAKAAQLMLMIERQLLSAALLTRPKVSLKPNTGYWERALQSWTENDYRKHLRLSRGTLLALTSELTPLIEKKDTNWKEAISVNCRVAITLWRLGSAPSYRTVAEHFGLGKTTVYEITIEICKAISQLLRKYVQMPLNAVAASQAFCMTYGMPNCIGAIDGCHIPIPKPICFGHNYWNRKQFYSINMQAVVDFKGRFIDIVVGWPGKVHDARVFGNSELFQKAQIGQLFPDSDFTIDNVNIPYYIIGDSAYPLTPYLMKPICNPRTAADATFSKKSSKARHVVERAFGLLKMRWRCLFKCCDASPGNASFIISSCVVLHNLCIAHDDRMEEDTVFNDDNYFDDIDDINSPPIGNASDIREAIKNFLT